MKAVKLVPLVLVACMLVGGEAASAAPVKEFSKSTGSSAYVALNTDVPIVCADGTSGERQVQGWVLVRENVTRSTDGGKWETSSADVTVATFNINISCDFTEQHLQGEVSDSVIHEQDEGASATVTGSVDLFDVFTGAYGGTVDISLAFTANSDPRKTTQTLRFVDPGTKSTLRTAGTFTWADVSGSIVLDGVNLLSGAEILYAELVTDSTSSMIKWYVY
jgi:hypothetical protein